MTNLYAHFFCSSHSLIEADNAVIQIDEIIRSVCECESIEVIMMPRVLTTKKIKPPVLLFTKYISDSYQDGDVIFTINISKIDDWRRVQDAFTEIEKELRQFGAQLVTLTKNHRFMLWSMSVEREDVKQIPLRENPSEIGC
jgi:hypothetical protein